MSVSGLDMRNFHLMETKWMAVKAPGTRNASHVLTRSQMPLQSSITLVWAPAPNNGAPISTYILEQSDKETGRYELVRALEDVLTCTVPNLQSGRSYWFRVRAENLVRRKKPTKIMHCSDFLHCFEENALF